MAYEHKDKKTGDGLAITDWNTLSSAVAGNSGLHLATNPADSVGIGTTTPSQKLEVNGNISLTGTHLVYNSTNGVIDWGPGDLYFRTLNSKGNVNNYTDRLVIAGNGNVGVGTSSPREKLEVNGNISLTGTQLVYNSANGVIGWGPGNLYFRTLNSTGNKESFSDRLIIANNGNVGIGTNDPKAKLSISGGGKQDAPDANMHITDSCILFGGTNSGKEVNSGQISVGKHAPDSLSIIGVGSASGTRKINCWAEGGFNIVGGVTATRFVGDGSGLTNLSMGLNGLNLATAGGNVGIGTNDPKAKLSVEGAIHIGAAPSNGFIGLGSRIEFRTSGVPAGSTLAAVTIEENFGLNLFGSSVQPVKILNCNLGIGTKNPQAKLSISGDGKQSGPDSDMHITNNCILFGGTNNGNEVNSGQISVGKHVPNSLNIVGVGSVAANRKINCWAEGGFNITGEVAVTSKVGIRTNAPKAPLHVVKDSGLSASEGTFASNGAFMNQDAYGNMWDNQTAPYNRLAAIFQGDVVADSHYFSQLNMTFSDHRAKEILNASDNLHDLQTLQQLKITDYRWIDTRQHGSATHKKLIAQEVKETFPQAVSVVPKPTVIPNVYQKAEAFRHDPDSRQLTVSTEKPHEFQPGDKVDLYTDQGDLNDVSVRVVLSERQFVVDCEKAPNEVFVYGKYVNDFLAVDYEAVAMLNVSATQELARQLALLQARLETVEKENAALHDKLASLEKTR